MVIYLYNISNKFNYSDEVVIVKTLVYSWNTYYFKNKKKLKWFLTFIQK